MMEASASPSGSTSLGESASAGRQSDEDDDLFYIPERRLSLDLDTSPMDTSHWTHVEKAPSPVVSYISLTSDTSDSVEEDDGFMTRVQLDRTDSYSSCCSLDSDGCEKKRDGIPGDSLPEAPDTPELTLAPDENRHPSLTRTFTFQAVCGTLRKLSASDLEMFQKTLWSRYLRSSVSPPQHLDIVDMVDRWLGRHSPEVCLHITKALLEEMGKKKMLGHLQTLCIRNEVRHDLSETLKRRYGGAHAHGTARGDDDIFVNLHITSTCDNGPNIEHEVMTIGKLDSNQEAGKQLSTKDLLSAEQLEHSDIQLILVTGVAGSGKSTAVRRLVLDWAEAPSHQRVSFLFPLPFRELRQFEGARVSLLDIVQKLYPETTRLRDEDYGSDDCTMMFVFDGLDEYDGELDFENTELLRDHMDRTSLSVMVVNLLRGRLLHRSLSVVTSRPHARHPVPWDARYEELEVRGFCHRSRDEYFRRRFQEPAEATAVAAYVNSSRTLSAMCHLPLFCSLLADECERRFGAQGPKAQLPHSIAYMYAKLLLALLRQRRGLRAAARSPQEETDFLTKPGKVAFNMLEEGKFKITESEWDTLELSSQEAVTNSGLCTRYAVKVHVLYRQNVLSFIHPTVQEFLAALYVFLNFTNEGKNVFVSKSSWRQRRLKWTDVYQSAVDRSLLCPDGQLDIFLRFLSGMALNTNLVLLKEFCTSLTGPAVAEEVTAVVRKKMRENPDRSETWQRCLDELSEGSA